MLPKIRTHRPFAGAAIRRSAKIFARVACRRAAAKRERSGAVDVDPQSFL
jgi:hypothetical protein